MTDLPGLPYEAITRWLETKTPSLRAAEGWSPELISGGLSNLTYRLHMTDEVVILRRPPLGGVIPRAHDMVREANVISALESTPVPIPTVLGVCTDRSVIGVDFYVMKQINGVVLRSSEDTALLTSSERSDLSRDVVEMLGLIHNVDPAEVGLSGFGRNSGYVERQLNRWSAQAAATPLGDSADMRSAATRLAEAIPRQTGSSWLHGDFKIDNTIVESYSAPVIVGVLDWELSSLGDPLADLGLALTYWHDAADDEASLVPIGRATTGHDGFWSSAQMASEYSKHTGRDISDLEYYLAFGAFKLAAILAGVSARHEAGNTAGEYPDLSEAVPVLASRSLRFLV